MPPDCLARWRACRLVTRSFLNAISTVMASVLRLPAHTPKQITFWGGPLGVTRRGEKRVQEPGA